MGAWGGGNIADDEAFPVPQKTHFREGLGTKLYRLIAL